jgi:uncharacterized protein YegP (UPF0339 family)
MGTFVIYKDTSGQYRWRLLASNNKIIADSAESYLNKTDCEHGISLVKQLAPNAKTVDTANQTR